MMTNDFLTEWVETLVFVPFYACKHAYESICVCVCGCVCVCVLAHAEASITLKSMPDLFLSANGPGIQCMQSFTVFTEVQWTYFSPLLYVFLQHRLKSCDSGENIRSHLEISALNCGVVCLRPKCFRQCSNPEKLSFSLKVTVRFLLLL